MELTVWLELLGKIVAVGVIVEQVISHIKDWKGSPEIKLVRDAFQVFKQEMKSLNETIRRLIDQLAQQ